jgi:hypothetical protein
VYHSEHSRADFLTTKAEGGALVKAYTSNKDTGWSALAHRVTMPTLPTLLTVFTLITLISLVT